MVELRAILKDILGEEIDLEDKSNQKTMEDKEIKGKFSSIFQYDSLFRPFGWWETN